MPKQDMELEMILYKLKYSLKDYGIGNKDPEVTRAVKKIQALIKQREAKARIDELKKLKNGLDKGELTSGQAVRWRLSELEEQNNAQAR